MANKYMLTGSSSLTSGKCQSNHSYNSIPARKNHCTKADKTPNSSEDVDKGRLLHIVGGNIRLK